MACCLEMLERGMRIVEAPQPQAGRIGEVHYKSHGLDAVVRKEAKPGRRLGSCALPHCPEWAPRRSNCFFERGSCG